MQLEHRVSRLIARHHRILRTRRPQRLPHRAAAEDPDRPPRVSLLHFREDLVPVWAPEFHVQHSAVHGLDPSLCLLDTVLRLRLALIPQEWLPVSVYIIRKLETMHD